MAKLLLTMNRAIEIERQPSNMFEERPFLLVLCLINRL